MRIKKENNKVMDASRQEKIICAARFFFTQKGYSATKLRDIAKKADSNLALVNYYFHSKQELFKLIASENIDTLFDKIEPALNDPATTVLQKIEFLTGHYIDLFMERPDFALFIINEFVVGSGTIHEGLLQRKLLINSVFVRQLLELEFRQKSNLNPIHLLLNLIGMLLLPLVMRESFHFSCSMSPNEFYRHMEERKKLLPLWISAMIN